MIRVRCPGDRCRIASLNIYIIPQLMQHSPPRESSSSASVAHRRSFQSQQHTPFCAGRTSKCLALSPPQHAALTSHPIMVYAPLPSRSILTFETQTQNALSSSQRYSLLPPQQPSTCPSRPQTHQRYSSSLSPPQASCLPSPSLRRFQTRNSRPGSSKSSFDPPVAPAFAHPISHPKMHPPASQSHRSRKYLTTSVSLEDRSHVQPVPDHRCPLS
jgi:hypothetical protein